MGGLSIWHWLVVGILILLLFGKGRFSSMMGDVAEGLKSFKKGMSEDEEDLPPRRIEVEPVTRSSVDAGESVPPTPVKGSSDETISRVAD